MKTVTMHVARRTLSQLVAAAEAGEDILIMRDREPAARLIAASESVPRREFGALAGKVFVTDAFFERLPADELIGWKD